MFAPLSSAPRPDLDALRRKIATVEKSFSAPVPAFSSGASDLDAALGPALSCAALHEVFAARSPDAVAAAGFTSALAMRAAGKREIVWVRQRYGEMEMGGLYAPGLAEFGLDPRRLVLVDARDPSDVLRAGEEAARCSVLGAVLIELWGDPKALDLTASRRLALAAERSGVTLFMLRAGAHPAPSAALTRWSVRPAPSVPLEADAPGHPSFAVTLLRNRTQAEGRTWHVEWNRDDRSFKSLAPVSRALVPVPADGSPAETASHRFVG
jgi:protein ImuA